LARKILRLALSMGIAATAPFLTASVGRVDNFAERTLASHNRERAALGIKPLTWDSELARDAKAWGARLSAANVLVHSPNGYRSDDEGENLWAGRTGHYGVESMVGLWVSEKKNYKPGIFPANSRTGNLEDVGHYTQVMWRSTGKVGCALVPGQNNEFMVCRYSDGGNVVGERPF
jgi:hypothetical protein